MEISFNEMQLTVFFRQLACTAVKHTTSAHHCLYLFALNDSINVCVSRHAVVGENSSQPTSLTDWDLCLSGLCMHACIHTYLHLLTLDSTSNDEKNGFQSYCGPSVNEKGFIIFNQHECELIRRGRFLFVNIDDSLSIAPGFMRVGNVEGKKKYRMKDVGYAWYSCRYFICVDFIICKVDII